MRKRPGVDEGVEEGVDARVEDGVDEIVDEGLSRPGTRPDGNSSLDDRPMPAAAAAEGEGARADRAGTDAARGTGVWPVAARETGARSVSLSLSSRSSRSTSGVLAAPTLLSVLSCFCAT